MGEKMPARCYESEGLIDAPLTGNVEGHDFLPWPQV